jgi:Ca2+-binding EF-hand superfamily protein
MDDNGDKSLDRYEFQWGLRENGHKLSPAEFEKIFKYFDKNNNGKIAYNEFLRAIRGSLNESRIALVKQVFKKLDKTGDGFVTTDDLVGCYNVEFHPKF